MTWIVKSPASLVVHEITEANASELATGSHGGVRLGPVSEDQLNSVLAHIRKGMRVFLVDWKGDFVLRRANVGGHEIDWAQWTYVFASSRFVGRYERLIQYGGKSRQHHQMLIYMY